MDSISTISLESAALAKPVATKSWPAKQSQHYHAYLFDSRSSHIELLNIPRYATGNEGALVLPLRSWYRQGHVASYPRYHIS